MQRAPDEPPATTLLSCQAIAVRRGRRRVLSDVALALRAGESLFLSGANGSGKTSLLRVLAGIAHPRSGSVDRATPCAYVPEKVVLASSLRPAEWIDAMCRIRGDRPRDWSMPVTASGLDPAVLTMRSSALSKGMLQRIALVEAIHSGCPLLLLDEPFAGLDGPGRDWLGGGIGRHVADGGGVIFTDHSGAAGTRLAPAHSLELADGRCMMARPTPVGARIAITAVSSDGERVTRDVDPASSDAVLGDLLASGWHIEEVGR